MFAVFPKTFVFIGKKGVSKFSFFEWFYNKTMITFDRESVASSFLHVATSQLCMASNVWFSSGAAMWGFVGSGTHAASCGYCEAAGFSRAAMGLVHHTVALNPVFGAGSGEAHGTTSASTTITVDQFLAILGSAISQGQLTACSTTMPRPMPADLRFLQTNGTEHPRSLWRAASLARRRTTSGIAVQSLDASVPPRVLPPEKADVVVVGGGLVGLWAAGSFQSAGAETACLEKSSRLGGVWRWYGNPFSRVNGARTLWARADLNTDELEEKGQEPLILEELVAGRLYTGPMYEKYNANTTGEASLAFRQ